VIKIVKNLIRNYKRLFSKFPSFPPILNHNTEGTEVKIEAKKRKVHFEMRNTSSNLFLCLFTSMLHVESKNQLRNHILLRLISA
jgi:hypothetical protein